MTQEEDEQMEYDNYIGSLEDEKQVKSSEARGSETKSSKSADLW